MPGQSLIACPIIGQSLQVFTGAAARSSGEMNRDHSRRASSLLHHDVNRRSMAESITITVQMAAEQPIANYVRLAKSM